MRVAYLGGSITAMQGWRSLTTERLRAQARAPIEEINAGRSGTNSAFGAYRLEADVLTRAPDVVFVEFAVNDRNAPAGQTRRALEGIVRKLWRADPRTDVAFVYLYAPEFAPSFAAGHDPKTIAEADQVARHYGIPTFPVARDVQRLLDDGSLVLKASAGRTGRDAGASPALTIDRLHPTAEGSRIYGEAVARYLSAALAGDPVERRDLLAAAPVDDANYEDATWVPLERARRIGNWQKVEVEGARIGQLWKATEPGSELQISFRGRGVELLVWLDANQRGDVAVEVDEMPANVRRVARSDNAGHTPGLRVIRLSDGLDPSSTHHVRVSLMAPATDSEPLRVLRASAFLVRGTF